MSSVLVSPREATCPRHCVEVQSSFVWVPSVFPGHPLPDSSRVVTHRLPLGGGKGKGSSKERRKKGERVRCGGRGCCDGRNE